MLTPPPIPSHGGVRRQFRLLRVLTVLPALIVGVGTYWLSRTVVTREVESRLAGLAADRVAVVTDWLEERTGDLVAISKLSGVRRLVDCYRENGHLLRDSVLSHLEDTRLAFRRWYLNLDIYDVDVEPAAVGDAAGIGGVELLAAQEGRPALIYHRPTGPDPTGAFHISVLLSGLNSTNQAVLIGVVPMPALFDLLSAARVPAEGQLHLVDSSGTILRSGESGGIPATTRRVSPRVLLGGHVEQYRDDRGVAVLGVCRWIPRIGLGILAERERAAAFSALGQWRVIVWSIVLAVTAAAVVIGAVLVNRMVHTLEQRETALWTIHEQLITADRLASVGMMAASVAHEVNNPLTTIRVLIHSVHERLSGTDPRRADLDVVQAEIDKIRALILRLLQFAKPREPELAAVQLNDILARVIDLIRPQAQMQNVTLVESYEPLPLIWADGGQLGQVFLNILLNAGEAVPPGGSIRVTTHVVGHDGVGASIWNSGPGLAPGLEERIFEPFFTTKATGTGLGLSIAHMIVDKHHGTIRAMGHGPDGTSFRITLPLGLGEGTVDGK